MNCANGARIDIFALDLELPPAGSVQMVLSPQSLVRLHLVTLWNCRAQVSAHLAIAAAAWLSGSLARVQHGLFKAFEVCEGPQSFDYGRIDVLVLLEAHHEVNIKRVNLSLAVRLSHN